MCSRGCRSWLLAGEAYSGQAGRADPSTAVQLMWAQEEATVAEIACLLLGVRAAPGSALSEPPDMDLCRPPVISVGYSSDGRSPPRGKRSDRVASIKCRMRLRVYGRGSANRGSASGLPARTVRRDASSCRAGSCGARRVCRGVWVVTFVAGACRPQRSGWVVSGTRCRSPCAASSLGDRSLQQRLLGRP